MSDIFYLWNCNFWSCSLCIGSLYMCQFFLWCFKWFFFLDPWRSRSRRGSCQVWFCRTARAEHLQNFIIRTHMVATGRLCRSKPLCPTFSNCVSVLWITFFLHRKVVRVSVCSMTLWMFLSGTLGGHVPVVGPVKCGSLVSIDLLASKISSYGHIWLPLADVVCQNYYVRHFLLVEL